MKFILECTLTEATIKNLAAVQDLRVQRLLILNFHPSSTIIVATQMKESMKVDGNFWTSLAVLIGSFIFMILMHFLLRNQKHTLEVVGIEINRQKITMEKQHAAIASNFTETFAALDSRYKAQRKILSAIDYVVVVGFVLSVFFFYKLNTPAQEWLNHCLEFLIG